MILNPVGGQARRGSGLTITKQTVHKNTHRPLLPHPYECQTSWPELVTHQAKKFYTLLFQYSNHHLAIASAVSEPAEFDVAVEINMSAYELLDGSDNPE